MKFFAFVIVGCFFAIQASSGQNDVRKFEQMAEIYYKAFKYNDAASYYSKAAKIYEKSQNWLGCIKSYRLTSEAFWQGIKNDTAYFYAKKACDLMTRYVNEDQMDTYDKSELFLLRGLIETDKERTKDALFYLSKALIPTGEKRKGDSLTYLMNARVLTRIGNIYTDLRKYDTALIFCDSACNILRNVIRKNSTYLADIYRAKGRISLNQGKYPKALELYQKAAEIQVDVLGMQHHKNGILFKFIGLTYYYMGEHQKALEYFQKVIKIDTLIFGENHPDVADCYNNIGLINLNQGLHDRALEHFQKALRIRINVYGEKKTNVAMSYNNIGIIYRRKEMFNEAISYYKKSLKILEFLKGENHPDLVIAYNNLGAINLYKGLYDSALVFFQKAIRNIRSNYTDPHPNLANTYVNMAVAYEYKKDYDKSLEYHQKATQIFSAIYGTKHQELANVYLNIGEVYIDKHEFAEALNYYQKALIANITNFSDTNIYINPTLENIYSEPILLYTIAGKANAFYQLYSNNTHSGKDIVSSLAAYEKTLQLINNMRHENNTESTKLLLSNQTKDYIVNAAHVAIEYSKANPKQPNEGKAFEFIEKVKSATLSARFHEFNAKYSAGIPDSLMKAEKEFTSQINSYRTEITKEKHKKSGYDTVKMNLLENNHFVYSRKLDSLISYFETAYPYYYKLKYENKVISISEIQSCLDNNSVVINYFIGDSSLFIAAISNNVYKIEEIGIDNSFSEFITCYYKSIKTADPEIFLKNNVILYEKLVKPVNDVIANKHHLVIIPDDYLYYIPFETLVQNAPSRVSNTDFSKLDYLIKSYSISYHHSATLWYNSLKRNAATAKKKNNFIGFAPVFGKEQNNGVILSSNTGIIDTTGNDLTYRSISTNLKNFNPLPYSKDEVTSIIYLFEEQKKEAKAYLYSEASESNFKASVEKYGIIHVSSHGFANDKEPALSGIVFSQPTDTLSKEDGILYTGETYNLSLNADLVVLSSCESGLGKLIKGEGLQALSRGFLYSGVPNVMFSLWKALDKPTRDMMVQFYSRILAGETYSESLRQAKLKMIKNSKTAFPHFWGGFVLVGK